MKRLLAVAGAILMVAAAILVRDRIEGNGGADDGAPDTAESSGELDLLCDETLVDLCTALEASFGELDIEVAAGPETLDHLSSAEPAGDAPVGWLTLSPLPDMVSEDRGRSGLPALWESPGRAIARSPLIIAAWTDRAEALTSSCPDEALDWRCAGDYASTPWAELGGEPGWGELEPGFADPDRDTIGLLVLGQAAVSYFGSPQFAANDFDDGAFRPWITGLVESVPRFPSTSTPLTQMLAAGPSSYDLVGTTEAEAVPSVAASREADSVSISYPLPMATADIVLVTLEGRDDAGRLRRIIEGDGAAAMFVEHGWRVPGLPPPAGTDDLQLPDRSGLPRPGVLEALRRL